MPDLKQTFLHYDQGMYQILSEKWDIELLPGTPASMSEQLIAHIIASDAITEIVSILPERSRQVMENLAAKGGHQTWAEFSRLHGDVRVMGPAKRDRERPDLTPMSTTEQLFYSGLIGKAFLQPTGDTQEYAYIPAEILAVLNAVHNIDNTPPGRASTPAEKLHLMPVNSLLVDDACTCLAALRSGIDLSLHADWLLSGSQNFLEALLNTTKILDASGMPDAQKVRKVLESNRAQTLLLFVQKWRQSETLNELHLLDGLIFEGNWENNCLQTRQTILSELQKVPKDTWWNLDSFIQAIKKRIPDFQRPGGDYDSWFIRRSSDEQYLRGFEYWDEVDGALIRYLITGPMHWLGLLELAASSPGTSPQTFRWSTWANTLLNDKPPVIKEPATGTVRLNSSGLISVQRTALRSVRYQLSRFCEWVDIKESNYRYRISPAGFIQAKKQGLHPTQLIALLQKHAVLPLPPGIQQAVKRWENTETSGHLQAVTLLRLETPEALEKLQRSRANRYITEIITPTTCLIRPGGQDFIRDTLAELGYLMDVQPDV